MAENNRTLEKYFDWQRVLTGGTVRKREDVGYDPLMTVEEFEAKYPEDKAFKR